jgi:hypothetical protein
MHLFVCFVKYLVPFVVKFSLVLNQFIVINLIYMKQLILLLTIFALYSCAEKDQVKTKNLISSHNEWTEEGFKTPPILQKHRCGTTG